jgi:ABC-type enterochelin transport system ATPase subunit
MTRISSDFLVRALVTRQTELIGIDGIPRSKMSSIMHRLPVSQRTKLWKYMKDMRKQGIGIAESMLLTHRKVSIYHTLQITTHVSVTEHLPYSHGYLVQMGFRPQ